MASVSGGQADSLIGYTSGRMKQRRKPRPSPVSAPASYLSSPPSHAARQRYTTYRLYTGRKRLTLPTVYPDSLQIRHVQDAPISLDTCVSRHPLCNVYFTNGGTRSTLLLKVTIHNSILPPHPRSRISISVVDFSSIRTSSRLSIDKSSNFISFSRSIYVYTRSIR